MQAIQRDQTVRLAEKQEGEALMMDWEAQQRQGLG